MFCCPVDREGLFRHWPLPQLTTARERMDPTVIVAIKAAADAAPDNLELRLHLVSLLANDAQPVEVLEQCGVILSRQPDHLEALAYAADEAMALGDRARAEGFRRLHRALGGLQARQPDPPVAGPP